MKFLVDAQLPIRLARLLREASYDTIHTRDDLLSQHSYIELSRDSVIVHQ